MAPNYHDPDSEVDETGIPPTGPGKPSHAKGQLIVITLEGHLDAKWTEWLGASHMALDKNGTTRLWVRVADQPMLYGVLMRIRDLGLRLNSIVPEDRP